MGIQPVHDSRIQVVGVGMLLLCYAGFISVHFAMGKNWSVQAEVKTQHQLVVHGPFRFARHPMYAVFLWFAVSAFVATLNWMIALMSFFYFLMVMNRIPIEEGILSELYGDQYLSYQKKVPALGLPWCCCYRSRSPSASGAYQQPLLV